MISRPTVFVIGAGASAELELPLGSRLKSEIASSLTFRFDFTKQVSGDSVLCDILQKRFKDDFVTYSKAGNAFAKVAGSFVSIDEALHYYSAQSEAVLLGKLAITRQILKAERESLLYSQTPLAKVNLEKMGATWLPHFLSMATSSLTMGQMDQAFQHVTVVNFNYDRSLEYYLYAALQEQLNLPADLAQDVVDNLTILRPYGSVGRPSWSHQGMPYGGGENVWNIDYFKASEGIRTYTEQNIDGETVAAIRRAVNAAYLVVILGFGFHEQNVSLLSAERDQGRRIFATVKNIAPPNHKVLASRIESCMQTQVPALLLDMAASEMLEKLRPSIMLAAN